MDTYVTIKTDKDEIDLTKMIQTMLHLQDNRKHDVMAAVETNKNVYLFYQSPYKSKTD